MDILQLLLGQIPEAIYFAVFMILAKDIRKKRVLFIILMILEYILLKQVIHFNTWFQVLYFIISFIIMKILYKDKTNITDIFTLGIASITLIFTSIPCYLLFTPNTILMSISNRLLLFGILFFGRNILPKIPKLYSKYWNRTNIPKNIKSTTFRALNLVIFNLMFFLINVGMIIGLLAT